MKLPSLPIAEKIKPKTLLTYKAVVTLLIRSFFDNGGLFANRTHALSCYIIAVSLLYHIPGFKQCLFPVFTVSTKYIFIKFAGIA